MSGHAWGTCPAVRRLSTHPTWWQVRQHLLDVFHGIPPRIGWRCPACGAKWTLRPVQGPPPAHGTLPGDRGHAADECGSIGPYEWCGAIRWRRPWRWTLDPLT